jgi:hypothetical protein
VQQIDWRHATPILRKIGPWGHTASLCGCPVSTLIVRPADASEDLLVSEPHRESSRQGVQTAFFAQATVFETSEVSKIPGVSVLATRDATSRDGSRATQ